MENSGRFRYQTSENFVTAEVSCDNINIVYDDSEIIKSDDDKDTDINYTRRNGLFSITETLKNHKVYIKVSLVPPPFT